MTGTTVAYNDNATTAQNGNEVRADIKTVDVAATTLAPKTIQAGAEANFFLTPDLRNVIYTYTQGSAATNGVYVVSAQ
jgi:hypothetical protein